MAQIAKSDADIEAIRTAIIRDNWHIGEHKKVAVYFGKFFDRKRVGKKIVAKVVGNHGTYTVSLSVKDGRALGACSCYIGRDGCHHCVALAKTFLSDSDSFTVVTKKGRTKIQTLEDLERYLEGVTLD